ncbi:hypothetical protein CYCD_08390 [Tenuifilaceae bacterium CYCD]|nr:hypothetical protein CYCD_08390 [Tenuifilaceae bacterium CYCD]
MLHTQTVESTTLELIESLQTKAYLSNFYLVGGTALALIYGHRKSVDIDLFTNTDFDALGLLEQIQHDFPFQVNFTAQNTIKGSINSIKVDLIAHRYPYLFPILQQGGIRLLSVQDIIAMKLNAISVSGQRSKDYIDIYYALANYSIEQMLTFYQKKYSQRNDTHILKSLVYFDDVDLADWPILLENTKITWKQVKKRIESAVLNYLDNHAE